MQISVLNTVIGNKALTLIAGPCVIENKNICYQVAETAKRAGVHVMEAFMWRFHGQHLRARKAIENGEIGSLRLVRAAFSWLMPRRPNVRLIPELAGGSVMDLGCYPISAARFYFGQEPAMAFAQGSFDPEYRVDMQMAGVLGFGQGQALIDCSFSLPYRTELELVGESGVITIPRAWAPDPEATLIINGKTEKLPNENQYIDEFEHFSKRIESGSAPLYGPEDAIRQMKVVDAVRRSMESSRAEAV